MSEQGKWLRQILLQVVRCCPHCQCPYEEADVRLLGQKDDAWILSLYCRSCHVLAIVGLGVTSTGEMSPQGVEYFKQTPPLGSDDLLDMHLFLERFDGDFRGLMERLSRVEKPPR